MDDRLGKVFEAEDTGAEDPPPSVPPAQRLAESGIEYVVSWHWFEGWSYNGVAVKHSLVYIFEYRCNGVHTVHGKTIWWIENDCLRPSRQTILTIDLVLTTTCSVGSSP